MMFSDYVYLENSGGAETAAEGDGEDETAKAETSWTVEKPVVTPSELGSS